MARKPTDIVQLKLRFPESLRRQLARLARENRRSMNTEIIFRLHDSVAASELERRSAGQPSLGKFVATFTIGGKPYRIVTDIPPHMIQTTEKEEEK